MIAKGFLLSKVIKMFWNATCNTLINLKKIGKNNKKLLSKIKNIKCSEIVGMLAQVYEYPKNHLIV